MMGTCVYITLVCSVCLSKASTLQDLQNLRNWSSPFELSTQLFTLTSVDSLSNAQELSLSLELTSGLMSQAVNFWNGNRNLSSLIRTTFEIVNNLIDNEYASIWDSNSSTKCISFLEEVDMFGKGISNVLKQTSSSIPNAIQLTNIEVVFTRLSSDKWTEVQGFTDFSATLSLLATTEGLNHAGITSIGYKSVDNILSKSSKSLGSSNQYLSSRLVSFSVSPNNSLDAPVFISITPLISRQNWTCAYLNRTNNGVWGTSGCYVSDEKSKVTCTCNHLTTFAILGCVEPTLPWQVITCIVISLICITLAFAMLVYFNRQYFSDIVVLVCCILVTLFLEQLCIVTGVFTVCNKSLCKAMALLIHFFDLSVFFWMFGQSVQIALKISYVTMESGGIMQYCALGWITPAFIVSSSVGLAHYYYGNDDYCAVPKTSHASIGPIVCVVGCNYICIVYIIYGYNNIRRSDNKAFSVIRPTKRNIAANGIVVSLMFITWFIWTSAIDEQTDTYYWLWALFILILGLTVLILYGVYNTEVQSELSARFGRKSGAQNGSVIGRAARSQHQLNEAIRLSQIIENSVVREQDSVVGDQIGNDSNISLTQSVTSSLATRVGFRKSRTGPSVSNAKGEGTTSNI